MLYLLELNALTKESREQGFFKRVSIVGCEWAKKTALEVPFRATTLNGVLMVT